MLIIPTTYLTHKPNVPPTALMPWTILVRPKGGTTGIVCKQYVHLQKIQLVEECRRLRAVHNLSPHGAARALGVNHTLLIRWTAKLPALKARHGKLQKAPTKGLSASLILSRRSCLRGCLLAASRGFLATTCLLLVGPHRNKRYIWNMGCFGFCTIVRKPFVPSFEKPLPSGFTYPADAQVCASHWMLALTSHSDAVCGRGGRSG